MARTGVGTRGLRVGIAVLTVVLLGLAVPSFSAAPVAAGPSAPAGVAPSSVPTHLPAALGGGAVPVVGARPLGNCPTSGVWSNTTYNSTLKCGIKGPTSRDDPVMASDANETILFGGGKGVNENQAPLNDTWEYASGAWTNITTSAGTAPSSREGEVFAFDTALNEFILWGGVYHPSAKVGRNLTDTWAFNATTGTWSNITKSVSGAPPPLYFPSGAYDPVDKEIVVFGGGNGIAPNGAPGKAVSAYTWILKKTGTTLAWSNLTSSLSVAPPAREQASMSWDGFDQELVLFGGYLTSAKYGDDTWSFVGGKWTDRTQTYAPPQLRQMMSAPDMADGGYVVMFGGEDVNSSYYNETWLFFNQTWKNVTGDVGVYTPPNSSLVASWTEGGLAAGAMDWDNGSGYVLEVGGYGYQGPLTTGSTFGINWQYRWSNVSAALTSNKTQVPVNTSVAFASTIHGGTWNYTYTYNGLPSGCHSVDSPALVCTPDVTGLYDVNVTAKDTHSSSATSNTIVINVYMGLTPHLTLNPSQIDLGHSTYLNVSVAGGSNGTHSYVFNGLPNGCSSSDTAHLLCTPRVNGTFPITVNVTDSVGDTAVSGPFVLTVWPRLGLVLSGGPIGPSKKITIDAGRTLYLNASVTGGDDQYTYSWSTLPSGCSPSDVAMYSCQPSASVYTGYTKLTVGVNVTDGETTLLSAVLPVTIWPSLHVTLNAVPLTGAAPFTTNLFGNASGGAEPVLLSWSAPGLNLVPPTAGQLNFSIKNLAEGNYSITLYDNDSLNYSQSASIELHVGPPIPPLKGSIKTSAPKLAADADEWVNFTANATGGLPPYTYDWTPATGCTAAGDQLSCLPPTKGELYGQVEILDSRNVSFSVPAVAVQIYPALQLALGDFLFSTCGPSSADLNATISGGEVPYNVTWSFASGGTATGVSVTHDFAALGSYAVSASVSDALGGTAHGALTVTISKCSSSTTSTASSLLPEEVGAGIAALVVVVALLFFLRGRRGGGGEEAAAPPAPAEPETKPAEGGGTSGSDEYLWGSDNAPKEETAAMEREGSGYAPPPGQG